jgi:CheY-like chemotaxis protein
MDLSSHPGLGTNVELWLPVSTDTPQSGDDLAAAILSKRLGTVLLVDDEAVARMSTTEMLTDMGYHVVEVGTAEEALRLLSNGQETHILVTDHLMPGITGVDLARQVQQRWPRIGILIISGFAEAEGVAPDLPRLTKPFRQSELAASLEQLRTGGGS